MINQTKDQKEVRDQDNQFDVISPSDLSKAKNDGSLNEILKSKLPQLDNFIASIRANEVPEVGADYDRATFDRTAPGFDRTFDRDMSEGE